MSKTTVWMIVDMICSFMLIVCGIAGITLNLAYIDIMVMDHFTAFVMMNVAYVVGIVLGWKGLSTTEEDS